MLVIGRMKSDNRLARNLPTKERAGTLSMLCFAAPLRTQLAQDPEQTAAFCAYMAIRLYDLLAMLRLQQLGA